MRGLVIGLVAGLVLVGCGSGGPGVSRQVGREVSADEFWTLMMGDGVEQVELVSDGWTARSWVAIDPPMDGVLIDALADPFAEDADWMKPGYDSERATMAKRLADWRALAEARLGAGEQSDWPTDEVTSRFGMVVAALVLESRLMALGGNKSGAAERALVTMGWVREAFESAPGMAKSDLMPSVVIAAEALTQFELEGSEVDAALELLDIGFVESLSGTMGIELREPQVQELLDKINAGGDAAEILAAVDPMEMGGEGETATQLQEALDQVAATVDWQATAKLARARYDRASPPSFEELVQWRDDLDQLVRKNWGQDVFEISPEQWDMGAIKEALKTQNNAVGVLHMAQLERGWLSKVESAYAMQMSLDAVRVGLGRKYDRKLDLVDGLTGKNYVIDEVEGILRTSRRNADPRFVFIQFVIERGAALPQ